MFDDLLDHDDDARHRRGAAWALGVIALAAVVIVGVIVLVVRSPASPSPGGADKLADPAVSSPASSGQSATDRPSATAGPTSASSSGTPSTPVPSPSSTSAVLSANPDGSGFLSALNSLRAQHHLSPVTGSVSSVANTCAADDGDTAACPGTYFWEPVATQSGSAALAKIEGRPGASNVLLWPKLASISIGWSHHAGGSWQCALLVDTPKS
jgi:hypothetical protein